MNSFTNIALTVALALGLSSVSAPVVLAASPCAETITFESIPKNTFVRDQFVGLGVRISGTGDLSGLVFSEGEGATGNYGNSPTQIVHVGQRGEPTTIQFVDPANPDQVIGASAVSILLGDGDPNSETFIITYFDVSGGVLRGPDEYTTESNGLRLSETSTTVGALIGSVQLELLPSSSSGVTFDDLEFSFPPSRLTICRQKIQLCFALDGSGGIGAADFDLEKDGIAARIQGTTVPKNGQIEVSVVQFPGGLEVPPTLINSQATADTLAISQSGGGTPMNEGIDDCSDAISGSPNFATAVTQVINLATNGAPSNAVATLAARDDAVAVGIDRLDAEAVGAGANVNFLATLVWPQPGEIVPSGGMPTGDTGFVLAVADFADFEEAIRVKIGTILGTGFPSIVINIDASRLDDDDTIPRLKIGHPITVPIFLNAGLYEATLINPSVHAEADFFAYDESPASPNPWRTRWFIWANNRLVRAIGGGPRFLVGAAGRHLRRPSTKPIRKPSVLSSRTTRR